MAPSTIRIRISEAQFPRDAPIVAKLFEAYANYINVDLTFQNFQDELAQLPGKYASENGGGVLLAYHDGNSDNQIDGDGDGGSGSGSGGTGTSSAMTADQPAPTTRPPTSASSSSSSSSPTPPSGSCVGCIAIRGHQPPNVCELKRLYIVPEARGLGAGGVLVEKALERARELGYKEMLLDTLSSMVAAQKLYVRYGFQKTEKYYENPLEDTVYYRARLV